jgi:hypothetical protein
MRTSGMRFALVGPQTIWWAGYENAFFTPHRIPPAEKG